MQVYLVQEKKYNVHQVQGEKEVKNFSSLGPPNPTPSQARLHQDEDDGAH